MEDQICRLCLQTISKNNCQAVEESLVKSLKLNINISEGNVMCIECANCLRVFSNFMSGCVYMGDGVLPSSDFQNGNELHPLQTEATSSLKSPVKTEIKCSFCTKAHGRADLISLHESKENKFMVDMLKQYISEMNLKNTEELLTCEACLGSMVGVFSVILKCMEVEEKINKYIKIEGTDAKSQVELKKVQQFMFKPLLKSEIELCGVNELEDGFDQVQDESTTMVEAKIKCEKEIYNTELIIKAEDDDITSEQSDCDIPDVKSEQQSDCNRFQEHFIENKSPSEIKTFQCEFCSYQTKWKNGLESHLFTHQDPSEIKMFKCELCTYEAKQKSRLKTHLVTHKSPSDIKPFKCELCQHETKRKSDLKGHLLTHKHPSEIKMFKCKLCSYQTRYGSALKSHLLTHRSPSEIKMFKCALCSYEAKRKVDLMRHFLVHKSPSEIKMFKCALCSYETKRKVDLRRHFLVHKSPSEIKMFRCALCPYEAKCKDSFMRHLLTHKSPSEVKMFKCALCPYETTQNRYLKPHLVTHKSPSEIEMFKCAMCPYEAKFKSYLRKHVLTHRKSPSEIEMC